jgi:hypothetical protein
VKHLIFLALVLAGCAKPSKNSGEPANQATKQVETVSISREACVSIRDRSKEVNFVINASNKFMYLITDQLVYKWDFTTVEQLGTEDVALGSFCILHVTNGILESVDVAAEVPSCGGVFQPRCPVPQPYPCGPNGQICWP